MRLSKLILLLMTVSISYQLHAQTFKVDTVGNVRIEIGHNIAKLSKIGGAYGMNAFFSTFSFNEQINKSAMLQAAKFDTPQIVKDSLMNILSDFALTVTNRVQLSIILSLSTNIEYLEIYGNDVHKWNTTDYIATYKTLQSMDLFSTWTYKVPYISFTLPIYLKVGSNSANKKTTVIPSE